MHLFFQRKETDDEILYMFIHPYFFLLIIIGGLIPFFYVIFWIITIIKFILLVFFIIFGVEFWKICMEARIAKKDDRVTKSGRLFSYFDPWTFVIKKERDSDQEKSITV